MCALAVSIGLALSGCESFIQGAQSGYSGSPTSAPSSFERQERAFRSEENGALCAFRIGHGIPPAAHLEIDRGTGAEVVEDICRAWGIPPIPVYIDPGSRNAYASTAGYITYDPIWFGEMKRRYGFHAPVGVLAHEVGHIALGIRVPNWIQDWSDEARADFFAGYSLAKLRADPRSIQAWLSTEGRMADHRHPDGMTRIAVVREGYKKGGGRGAVF